MKKLMTSTALILALALTSLIWPSGQTVAGEKLEITRVYFTHFGAVGPANIMCVVGTGYPKQMRVFIDGDEVSFTRSADDCVRIKVPVNYAPETHSVQVTDWPKWTRSNIVRVRF